MMVYNNAISDDDLNKIQDYYINGNNNLHFTYDLTTEFNDYTEINIHIKDKVGNEVNVDNYELYPKGSISLTSLYTEYGNSEFTLTPQFEKNNNSKPIIYINHNYPDETIVYFLLNDRIYDNLMNKKSKYIYQFQDNLNTNDEYRIRAYVYLENGNIEFSNNEISIDINTDSVENDTSTLTLNSHYKPNDPLFEIPDHFIYRFKDSNASRAYSHIMYNQGIYLQSSSSTPMYLSRANTDVTFSENGYSFYPHQYNTDLRDQFRPLLHNDYFILNGDANKNKHTNDCGWYGCHVGYYHGSDNILQFGPGGDLPISRYLRIVKKYVNENGNRLIKK